MDHGLNDCIILHGGTPLVSTKMMATALEAIMGAVHMDGGVDALAGVMSRLGLVQHPLLPTVISFPLSDVVIEYILRGYTLPTSSS
jgi:hypothetical protein